MSASIPLPALDPVDARVLGVLVEKQHTVPDTYPLSLNALVAGCNQKSSRDPVLELSEGEVMASIDRLKTHTLVVESSGGRVSRYAHNVQRVLQVPGAAISILAILMLRGPQTTGELRINTERLHRFADLSTVEAYLEELAARSPPLVKPLPRGAGAREIRWAHLLCGEPASAEVRSAVTTEAEDRMAALEARVQSLEDEVAQMRAWFAAQAAASSGR